MTGVTGTGIIRWGAGPAACGDAGTALGVASEPGDKVIGSQGLVEEHAGLGCYRGKGGGHTGTRAGLQRVAKRLGHSSHYSERGRSLDESVR